MVSMEKEIDESLIEGFRRESIDYKQVLMIHLNRISFLMSKINERGSDLAFYLSVVGLEAFLNPYLDGDFRRDKECVYNHVKKNEKLPKNLNKILPFWSWSSGDQEPDNIRYSILLLAVLQELMGRKNLLLEKEMKTKVGYGKEQPIS